MCSVHMRMSHYNATTLGGYMRPAEGYGEGPAGLERGTGTWNPWHGMQAARQ